MRNSLIVSVLGFLLLSACTGTENPLIISTVEQDQPKLVLPKADTIKTRDVSWIVVTRDNVEEKFKQLEAAGKPVAIIGLDGTGYENLALNINDLRSYVQQQKAIILAYETYYINN